MESGRRGRREKPNKAVKGLKTLKSRKTRSEKPEKQKRLGRSGRPEKPKRPGKVGKAGKSGKAKRVCLCFALSACVRSCLFVLFCFCNGSPQFQSYPDTPHTAACTLDFASNSLSLERQYSPNNEPTKTNVVAWRKAKALILEHICCSTFYFSLQR